MFRITPSLTSVCSIRYVAPPCTRMKNWWKSLSCWNIETSVPLSMVTCLFVCVSIAATSWPSSTWKTCVPRPLATLVDTVIFLCCVLVVFWEPGCVVLAVVSCRCMFMVWVAGNPSLRSRGGGTTIGFNIDIFARFGGGFSFPLPFRFLRFRTASDVISLSALFLWDCDSLRRSRLPNQWPPTAWGTRASDVPRCDCRTERSVVVGCRTVAVYGMRDAS